MSKHVDKFLRDEWRNEQTDVHPVWEARTIPAIEQWQELAISAELHSSEVAGATPFVKDTQGEVP